MNTEQSRSARRQFIRQSAYALTGLGLGRLVTSPIANAQSTGADPRVNYPWEVDVDLAAQISLYLIQDNTVEQLFADDLHTVVSRMTNRLANAPTLPNLVANLREDDLTVEQLDEALAILSESLLYADALPGYTLRTYFDYATTSKYTQWNPDVRAALEYLAHFICVPVLNVSPNNVVNFISQHATAIGKFAGSRTVRTLFTTRCTDFVDGSEIAMFRAARDVGLIWCNPRGKFATAGSGRDYEAHPVLAKSSNQPLVALAKQAPRTDSPTRSRSRRILEAPVRLTFGNGYRCNPTTHQCYQTGNPDDYCQQVDGVCNAMGT